MIFKIEYHQFINGKKKHRISNKIGTADQNAVPILFNNFMIEM